MELRTETKSENGPTLAADGAVEDVVGSVGILRCGRYGRCLWKGVVGVGGGRCGRAGEDVAGASSRSRGS